MKLFAFFITALFFCISAHAQTETINWYMDGNTYATTQCESGGDITLPTTPTKYGYTFQGWTDHTPIEYLESTGTQYIDTGIIAQSSVRLLLQIFVPNTGTHFPSTAIFGARNTQGSFWSMYFPGYDPNAIRFDYAGQTNLNCTSSESMQGKIVTIDINKNNKVSIYDINQNLLCAQNLSITTFTTDENMILFGTIDARSGTPTIFIVSTLKIYYAKIWDNGTLVRDMVPVLDHNGIPCMYDKVENKFYYNAGTGDFIAGPVIGNE